MATLNNVIAILYRREDVNEEEFDEEDRKKIEEQNESGVSLRHCTLTPLEILDGYETVVNGHRVFIPKNSNNSQMKMINDPAGQNDEFIYGFPIPVNEYNDSDKREIITVMKNEKLYNLILFQNFEKDRKDELVTFTNDYIRQGNITFIVDPTNYNSTLTMLHADVEVLKRNYPNAEMITVKPASNPEPQEETKKVEKAKPKIEIYSDKIFDEVSKYVACQDEAIKMISSIFARNYLAKNRNLKSNFILCGPTGVGKTEIFRQLAKAISLPIIQEDSSEFTAEGYVGRSVTSILTKLLVATNWDFKAAEHGIIYIDEIDKKAGDDLGVTRGAVIDAFLKMMEGHEYVVVTPEKKEEIIDTSRMTFVFGGAFSGIEKYADIDNGKIGFGRESKNIDPKLIYNPQTIMNFGLKPEFVGRCNVIALNSFHVPEFMELMHKSELSYLKLYRDFLMSARNIELVYDEDTIRAIAEKADKLKEGARGIKNIVEQALLLSEFYTLSSNYRKYKQLIITPETIEDNKKYILK